MTEASYSWFQVDSTIVCYPSPNGWQFVAPLAESRRRTAFHDDTLAQATQEINAIMNRMNQNNDDPSRVLSLIAVPGGRLLLVWASSEHPLTPHSDPQSIADAFGLEYPEEPA